MAAWSLNWRLRDWLLISLLPIGTSILGGCASKLIIHEEHVGPWMPIDNGFAEDDAPEVGGIKEWERRTGVLLQLGTIWKDPGYTVKDHDFARIEVEVHGRGGPAGTTQTFILGQFDWINIVSVSARNFRPVNPADQAYNLFRYGSTSSCPIEDCINPSPVPSNCTPQLANLFTGTPGNPPKITYPCLRGRSLHGWFTPSGAITYWHGPAGYLLTTRGSPGRDHYTFRFPDQVRVIEVWKDKEITHCISTNFTQAPDCNDPAITKLDLGRIDTILVDAVATPGSTHGEVHKTPTDH